MWSVGIALLVSAFWSDVPPEKWSEVQLRQMFVESPWAQQAQPQFRSQYGEAASVYLASAAPMREAEAELRRRTKPGEDVLFDEYKEWLEANASTHIVVAVRLRKPELLADAVNSTEIEKESKLVAGGKRYGVAVTFPPTRTDPWLRLAFPRKVRDTDKHFEIELYLPGVAGNYLSAVFSLKDLVWKGKFEM